MRRSARIVIVIVGLLIVLTAGFIIWGETPSAPMPEALAALQPDTQVMVTTSPWLTFQPVGAQVTVGFIIYPGSRVDDRAYAPQAHAIAASGFLVVIVPMPLNLAVLNPNAAQAVISSHPEIKRWAIGGHSLGGAMAASFANSHPTTIQGLVLWASYPAASDDLSESNLQVLSIYGTNDGLATPAKINASRPLLPKSTTWVSIQGGNHGQFGWYGLQPGDNPAGITRQMQQMQVIQTTMAFLTHL